MRSLTSTINLFFIIYLIMNLGSFTKTQAVSNAANATSKNASSSNSTNSTFSSSSSANGGSEGSCFLGNTDEMITILEKKVEQYVSMTEIKEKKEIKDFFRISEILGTAQGNLYKENTKGVKAAQPDLQAFRKTSFVAESAYSLFALKNGVTHQDFESLFTQLKDELTKVATKNSYAVYYTQSLLRLLDYTRGLNNLKVTTQGQCVPFYLVDLLDEAVNDPSEELHFSSSKPSTDDIKIDPNDFGVSEVAVAFFALVDAGKLDSKGKFAVQGFNNNVGKLDHSILNGKEIGSIVNRFNIEKKTIDLTFQTGCTELFLFIFSFEKLPYEYRLRVVVKTVNSNKRQEFQVEAPSSFVEGLKLIFIKEVVQGPQEIKNFFYSPEEELRVAAQMGKGYSTFQNSCDSDPICQYFSLLSGKCLLCKKGYYSTGGKCSKVCPEGTFPNDSTTSCDICSKNCKICKSSAKCDVCSSGYMLTSVDGTSVTCVDQCGLGYIKNDKTKTCDLCPDNCKTCTDTSTCSECNNPFFIFKGKCVNACPAGFFTEFSPKSCKPCVDGCESCLSFEKCTKCKEGLFMKDGVCVKVCGDGFFAESYSRTCRACISKCKECLNDKECETCLTGYAVDLSTKQCSNACDCGEILFKGVCIRCGDDNCDACDYNNVNFCKKCDAGYVVQEGKCKRSCDEGFYANEKSECTKCTKNCKVCTKDKCLLCQDGSFLLNDVECPKDCPEGYIASGKSCIKCKSTECKKCSEKNLEVCVSCYLGEVLKEGKCVKDCGLGYYKKDLVCEKCMNGCSECQDNVSCKKCDAGLFLKDGQCVTSCGNGYRPENKICEKCKVNNCDKCELNANECSQCKTPKVIYGNQCYDICPLSTFLGTDRMCYDCPKDCDVCENASSCLKCRNPKVLQGKKCLSECADGFKNVNSECKACTNSKCKSCDASLKSCIDCSEGEFLYSGNCVAPCPKGTYQDGKQCSPCKKPCTDCKSSKICLECDKGFLLSIDTCTDKCDDGFIELNKKCVKCQDEGCVKCNQQDLTECIKCLSPRALLNGDCYDNCPDNYYKKNGQCLKCLKGCKECISSTDCDKCEEGLFLKNKQSCEKECGNGWIEVDGTCVQCKGNCRKCKKDNTSFCTECPLGQFILDGKCLNTCPDKYWEDQNSCKSCQVSECLKCVSKGQVCEKCSTGFLLDENKCVDVCPPGKVQKNDSCKKCEVANCQSCPPNDTKSCTQCLPPKYLISPFICDSACPSKSFANKLTQKCSDCLPDCLICDDEKSCRKCVNGFLLQEGECVKTCKEGYRSDVDKCSPCDKKDCAKCTEKDCLSCKSPLVLSEGLCEFSCKSGFYLDKKTQACVACGLFCESCLNADTCGKCSQNKILNIDGKCIDSCPDGSVQIGTKCEICKTEENCQKCSEKKTDDCIICKSGYALLNNKCYDSCPKGYFNSNGVCKKCIANCDACSNDLTCDNCVKNFYLLDKVCVQDCPMSFYKYNGKCVLCSDSSCETCNSEKCLKCLNGFYLEDGVCKKQCSPGYFLFNFLECRKCEDNCFQCENADTCTNCVSGFLLKNGDCVQDCSTGYVKSGTECKPCSKGCQSCSSEDPSICEVCLGPLVLLNGSCASDCGSGYYLDKNYGQCRPCNPFCDQCKDNQSCSKCQAGFVYMKTSNTCVTECEDGYKNESSICEPCKVKDCKKCNTAIETCDVCESNVFKLGSTCVPECDSQNGFYIDTTTKECKKCPTECKSCNESECKSCRKGFVLNDGKCDNKCDDGEIEIAGECQTCKTAECSVCQRNLITCDKCKGKKVLFTLGDENPTTCEESCPEGYFVEEGKCKQCGENCKFCLDSIICSECKPGFLMKNEKCVQSCDKGWVERNGKCIECADKNCVSCNNILLDTCNKCELPHKLLNGKCVTVCPEGYFVSVIGNMEVCSSCPANCSTCLNSDSCEECKQDFFLKEGSCVDNCGDNYIKVGLNCNKCSQPECRVCSMANFSTCLECKLPFYLSDQATCIEDCAEGYYKRHLPTKACVGCTDSNCLQCSPENMCHSCQKAFVLFNSNCVAKCPDGYYIDAQNICQSCGQKECSVCNLQKSSECEVCKSGFLRYMTKCVEKCPDGTFPNQANECQNCPGSCELCSSEINCSKCVHPFLYQINRCVDNCGDGSVEVAGKCEKCKDKKCVKCDPTNLEICIECDPEKVLNKGTCIDNCPIGTYLEGRSCLDCEGNCEVCENSTTCLECDKIHVEFNADCLTTCNDGWTDVNKHCKECKDSANCLKCNSDLVTCESCRYPYILAEGVCIEKCPIGKFYDSVNFKCESCPEHCEECEIPTACKKCASPFVLDFNGSCVVNCGDKFYVDFSLQRCKPCTNNNCLNCDANSPSKCIECSENTYLIARDTEIDCVDKCPEGFFKNIGKDFNYCKPCPAQCMSCSSETECDSCNTPLILNEHSCISSCPKGFVQRDSNCYKCSEDSCEICDSSDLNKCLKCKEGILWEGLCIKECPVGYRQEMETCAKCPSNCETCDESKCLDCYDNFYYDFNKECVTCLQPNLIIGDNCVACKVSGCNECDPSDPNSCKLCDSKFLIFESKCIVECPKGYFKDGNTCSPCSSNCDVCNGTNDCSQCSDPFLLHAGACANSCPDHFTNVNKKCESCSQSECIECEPSLNKCLKCDAKTILFESKCVTSCPVGYFLNVDKCETCSEGCNQCDKSKCTECQTGLKIKVKDCKANCGDSFFDSGSTCTPCSDSNCVKCSPENKCQQCNKDTYLLESEGVCQTTCPDGYFPDDTSRICRKCDLGCEKCTDSKKCFSCITGFFMYNGECYQSCPSGTASMKENCVKCTEKGCLECMPENPNKCTKCIQEMALYNNVCLDSCPMSTFEKDNQCVVCDSKCLSCTDETKCTNCRPEFKLSEGVCVNDCPDGKVLINGICASCASDKCLACSTDVNSCLKCSSPYKLYKATCVLECPQGSRHDGNGVCVKCKDGCENCNEDDTCDTCQHGYYLFEKGCVSKCPSGFYGECGKCQCKQCDSSCNECVGASNKNCVNCATDFFKNENACVKAEECPQGTYPNKSSGECTNCHINYCEKCSDSETCTQCVRGFVLKDGKCIEGKTYVNLINEVTLSDEYSYKNKRLTEIFQVNDEGGVGVGAPHVSFTFWVRLMAPITEPTNIISIKGDTVSTYDFRFFINQQTNKCVLEVINRAGDFIQSLENENCKFGRLSSWTFFLVSIDKQGSDFVLTVNTLSGVKDEPLKEWINIIQQTGPVTEILEKNSRMELNDNEKRGAFQIFNLNLLDYHPKTEDMKTFTSAVPPQCDYFCTDCQDKCKMCVDNLPPVDGFCRAHEIRVSNGVKVIDDSSKSIKYELRSDVHDSFVSTKYAFATWFYIDSTVDLKLTPVTIYSDAYSATSATGLETNNLVILQNGLITVNGEKPLNHTPIVNESWYFLSVGFLNQNYKVWLYDSKGKELINANYSYEGTLLFLRIWESYTFEFSSTSGSLLNTVLYINNLPDDPQIKKLVDEISCPNNCSKCSKTLKCDKCKSGFKLRIDGTCQTDIDINSVKAISRFDLWNKESISYDATDYVTKPDWSLSVWLRKKVHSNVPLEGSATHNIIGLKTNDNFYSIISETLKPEFNSEFEFSLNSNSTEKWSKKFDGEVFDFIHIAVISDSETSQTTFNVKDFATNEAFVRTMKGTIKMPSTSISSFIVGDEKGVEVNMEVTSLQFFQAALDETSVDKIRGKKPKDCDSACLSGCDFETGVCGTCGGTKLKAAKCNALLVGYTSSFIYGVNSDYSSLNDLESYRSKLSNQGFSSGINSLGYSLLGYFNVFDFISAVNSTDARVRVFTLGNMKSNNFTEDAGKEIIALDLLPKDGKASVEFIINASSKKETVKVSKLSVVPNTWYAIHAGIDVKTKLFKFKFLDMKNGQTAYNGEQTLQTYPEKLQQIGGLTILGALDNLNSGNYAVPSIRLRSLFFVANSAYDDELFKKYLNAASMKVPADPTCPENCGLCIENSKKVVECLACQNGFFKANGQCILDESIINYEYLVLSDKIVTLPTEFVVNQATLLQEPFSLIFFVRKNFHNAPSRNLISYGKIKVNVVSSDISDKIEVEVEGISDKLTAEFTDPLLWHSVVISLSKAKALGLSVISENKKSVVIKSYINYSNALIKASDSLKVNTNNFEYQFQGIHISSRSLTKPTLSWPELKCSVNCLFCARNTCMNCLYGRNSKGACITRPVAISSEDNYSSAKLSAYLPLTNYRSNVYTIFFVAEFATEGIINLFKLNNLNSLNSSANENHLSISYDTNTYKFFIGYNNRYVSAIAIKEEAYLSKPVKAEHFVSLSVENDTISYVLYNTNNNLIKGTIKIEGEMDYLTSNANFFFFGAKPSEAKNLPGTVKDIKFYYERALTLDELIEKAKAYGDMVQSVCAEGTKFACNTCSEGFLNNKICVPTKDSAVFIDDAIMPVNRWGNSKTAYKYSFAKGVTSLDSFNLSFWWKATYLLNQKQGIISISLSDGKTAKTLYNLVFTPQNTIYAEFLSSKHMKATEVRDFMKGDEVYNWVNFNINVNYKTNKHVISLVNENTNRNVESESTFQAVEPITFGEGTTVMYLTVGFGDENLDLTDNVSFEMSYLTFVPNSSQVEEIKKFKVNEPREVYTPCSSKKFNSVCPDKERLTQAINIGDIFLGSDIKPMDDLSHLSSLPLFRPVSIDAAISQSFNTYLVSFDLEVNAFLSSAYAANKDILFVLHNDNKEVYDNLSMSDLIPNSLSRLGGLSLVNDNGALRLYNGYVPWNSSVNSVEVPLGGRPISSYSKIYFSILTDVMEKSIKLVVIADNALYSVNVGFESNPAPINFYTLVYNHPAINKINLNLFSPRLEKDLAENAQSHTETTYVSNFCSNEDKNCRNCNIPENSKDVYCLDCKPGFKFYSGACNEEHPLTK